MTLIISLEIEKKLLRKHNVRKQEVIDCFANRDGAFLIDGREEHKTDPQTHWFIAETDYGVSYGCILYPDLMKPAGLIYI